VGMGPVFASPTKPDVPIAGLSYVRLALSTLRNTTVGHVVIGGVTERNIQTVLDAGVRAVAVGSAVTDSPDPNFACKRLKDILLRVPPNHDRSGDIS
jgi:thiamine-phosphate pyrophosphorylase